jgi:hypothetical protein
MASLVVPHRVLGQVPFALSISLTNGTFIRSVTTADVNNDGKPDLICARANPSFLYIWTNSGNGLFASNASYTVGAHPFQVIAADVNNDGKPDLITANTIDSLTVLTNNGQAAFALAANLPLAANSQPVSIAAADLNGDGRVDLISANSLLATFTVWTNSGDGNFVSNVSLSVGSPGYTVPQWVTTADVNGDGKLDIIGASDNVGPFLFIWTNNGSGGFVSAPAPSIGSPGISCIVATDVNGDGKADLACVGGSVDTQAKLLVLTNNGTGGFAISSSYPVGTSPYAVVAPDVNGDGSADLITCNQGDNTLSVLTNNGAGVFGSNTTLAVGSGPESLTAADFNSDGRIDLISGNWNSPGTLTVLTNAAIFLPKLTLKYSGNSVIVSWPTTWVNWTLQQNTNLIPVGWTSFVGMIGNDGTTKSVTNSSLGESRFFRLSKP